MVDVFAGLAAGAASAGVQQAFNKSNARREQDYYEKNQAKAFEYSQTAQQMAVPNAVMGLKMAGLNPASAAQGAFNAAPMSAPPMQNKAAGLAQFPIAESMLALAQARKTNELLDAQKDNINADTANKLQGVETGKSQVGLNESQVGVNEAQGKKLAADTQLSEYQYRNQRNVDSSIFTNLMTNRREDMEQYFNSLGLDINNPSDINKAKEQFSVGSLYGENEYFKLSADKIESMNREYIALEFQENPKLLEATAEMPYYEKQKLITDIAYTKTLAEKEEALTDKLVSDTRLSNQQRENLKKEIQKIDADIKEVKARTERVSSEKFKNYAIGASAMVGTAWDVVETFLPKGFVKKVANGATSSSGGKSVTKQITDNTRFPVTD